MRLAEKQAAHRGFWRGEGPSLILIPADRAALYDTEDYSRRFDCPELMWESEVRRARAVADWPTDGIPSVRPNLGVIFIPAMAGLPYEIREGQMPWPRPPLSRDSVRAARGISTESSDMMRRAAAFYSIHRNAAVEEIAAYQPDTQGVFDIAHLLDGESILYEMADDPAWVHEVLEVSLDLYLNAVRRLKVLLDEPRTEMIHGHGTPQGIWFPQAGTRVSEDTATLLAPRMLESFVLPYIERATAPFGGGFVHFCGKHRFFLEALCRMPLVRAIDLGNSEMYDPRWLLEKCAETGTVLYSRMSAEPGETWRDYVIRIAGLVKATGARCALRPTVYPESREECASMRDLWRELTS